MKILIVDDHEVVRQGVSSLLRSNGGYDICGEAADGREAIRQARELCPEVIVMDISMPNLNGLDATRSIREFLPHSEVLIMSQHDSPQVVHEAFEAGARGYVVKSSLARELLNAVAAVGRHQPFVDPKISTAQTLMPHAPRSPRQDSVLNRSLGSSENRGGTQITPLQQVVWLCDARGRNIWTSHGAATSPSEADNEGKETGWLHLVHPDDRRQAERSWAECLHTGTPYRQEFRYRMPDGTFRDFDSRAVPVKSGDGTIREWIGVNIDITDRKRVEMALRASEERTRFTLEAAHFGTWDWNMPTGEVQWSVNMAEIHGQAPGSFDGNFEAFLQGVHAEDRAHILKRIEEAIAGDGNYHAEYRQVRSNGTTGWMEAIGRVVYDAQHFPVRMMGICMDITKRKRTEAAVQNAQSDLEKRVQERTADLELAQAGLRHLSARLLQAQDEERRRIARELHDSAGQLLAALSMTLTPLEGELQKTSPRWAGTLASSMKLVDELSKELRTISHLLHPPMLDEAGLEFALRWYVEGFAERSRIDVKFEFADNLGRLSRELETTIFRLIQESLTNIHRHSGSGTASIRLWRRRGNIHVEVRDRGRGMPSESRAVSSGPVRPGVGIQGMRERVRELGGTLEICSDKTGTVVLATVPFREALSSAAKAAETAL